MIDSLIYHAEHITRAGDGQLCEGVDVGQLLLESSHDWNIVFNENPVFFVVFVGNAWFDQSVGAIGEADQSVVGIRWHTGVGFPDLPSDDDDEGENDEFEVFLQLLYTSANQDFAHEVAIFKQNDDVYRFTVACDYGILLPGVGFVSREAIGIETGDLSWVENQLFLAWGQSLFLSTASCSCGRSSFMNFCLVAPGSRALLFRLSL